MTISELKDKENLDPIESERLRRLELLEKETVSPIKKAKKKKREMKTHKIEGLFINRQNVKWYIHNEGRQISREKIDGINEWVRQTLDKMLAITPRGKRI